MTWKLHYFGKNFVIKVQQRCSGTFTKEDFVLYSSPWTEKNRTDICTRRLVPFCTEGFPETFFIFWYAFWLQKYSIQPLKSVDLLLASHQEII